jgi:hypothetical protein
MPTGNPERTEGAPASFVFPASSGYTVLARADQ